MISGATSPLPSQATGYAGRVLLIDDDDLIAISLRHYLTARGCEVHLATDRWTAEELLTRHAYGVILLDPYLTGEVHHQVGALIHMIRAMQPDARVLISTAYIRPEITSIARDHDVAAVVIKPQSVVFLSQLVLNVSGHRAKGPLYIFDQIQQR